MLIGVIDKMWYLERITQKPNKPRPSSSKSHLPITPGKHITHKTQINNKFFETKSLKKEGFRSITQIFATPVLRIRQDNIEIAND